MLGFRNVVITLISIEVANISDEKCIGALEGSLVENLANMARSTHQSKTTKSQVVVVWARLVAVVR